MVDHAFKDDAAVVAGPRPGLGLVLTADVIAPLVDDPASFGAIAAANALSDVYAMGGEPRFALNLAFFCDDKLPLEVLRAIQDGAAAVCARAGVAVVGGHTVRDPELKFGLSVTGEVPLDRVWTNRGAAAGQALVLTKALGTGVLGQAIKAGAADDAEIAAAIASMTTLNRDAMEVGRARGVTAATDVTGFGLAGHLRNILRGSGLAATLDHAALPFLPGFARHAAEGRVPGGSKTNRSYLEASIAWARPASASDGDADAEADAVRERTLIAVTDAQTSGGLLLCLPAAEADAAVADLRARGAPAARIGELHAPSGEPWLIRIV
ncbi:MAG TPA: selenide, water dikinase SelD [Kofleriaceae bacterium]|nr:selenide, water dikinase SelD [Kofleriaceae bacterium]